MSLALSPAFALVTGATSGIGEAFAKALPKETDLFLTGRNEARLAELAETLGGAGRRVETFAADLAGPAGRAAVIERASALPLDLLINNAGLGYLDRVIDNTAEAEREMVEVNCLATVELTRALLPGMLARAEGQGRRAGVIVVASAAAFTPLPYLATYAATKAFDLFYAEALAGELAGAPVDVLALCPGGTRTDFFARAGFGRLPPLMATPEHVAREGLAALGRRPVHVVGAANRASVFAGRLLPRFVARLGVRRAMRRFLKNG